MSSRIDPLRFSHPLFQVVGAGLVPRSPLDLLFAPIDLGQAKRLNRLWHSRFPEVGGGGARVCYAAEFGGVYYAVAIWTNPTSPKLPQREWLLLKRFAIAPDSPRFTASCMLGWMLRDIRVRFPEVTTLVSYSDPDQHEGVIYKASNWQEGETTRRPPGAKRWHNRERGRVTRNRPCERVTRWTKTVR